MISALFLKKPIFGQYTAADGGFSRAKLFPYRQFTETGARLYRGRRKTRSKFQPPRAATVETGIMRGGEAVRERVRTEKSAGCTMRKDGEERGGTMRSGEAARESARYCESIHAAGGEWRAGTMQTEAARKTAAAGRQNYAICAANAFFM